MEHGLVGDLRLKIDPECDNFTSNQQAEIRDRAYHSGGPPFCGGCDQKRKRLDRHWKFSAFFYPGSRFWGLDSRSKCNSVVPKEYLKRSIEIKAFPWT